MEASGVYLVSSSPLAAQRMDCAPELLAEIRRLKEESAWMEHLLEDDTERAFTYGEDGTMQFGFSSQGGSGGKMFSYDYAYANSLFRPSYGACFYVVEMQRQIMLARSRAFCSQNPYQHGAIYARKTHVVGKGHTWTVVPRDPENKPDKKKVSKFQKELDNFYEGTDIYEPIGPYRECQKEKVERESRDGEFIVSHGTYGQKKDKCYRPIFIEPLLVWTPESLSEVPQENEVLFGVQYRKGDYDLPLKYHVRKLTLLGSADLGLPTRDAGKPLNADEWARGTDAREIQHRKANVDKSWPRGVPDTYWVQERLSQSIRTLHAMGVLVQVRAKVAMITKRVNALEGSLTPLLNAQGAAQITPSGQTMNALTLPYGSMINSSDQVDYQFPAQNIEVDKIVASIQADLQACAVSLGVADYMMSGNLGRSSYASSMVASGPVVKTFEDHQQDMIDDDRKVIRRVAMTAIEAGRLDADTLDVLTVEQHGPSLATSDGVQEAQARQIEHQQGILSKTTWRQLRSYDPHREARNFEDEAKNEAEIAAAQAELMPAIPGGTGGGSAGGQPRGRQTPNLRPFSADQEPRQIQRASGATKEEETIPDWWVATYMQDGQPVWHDTKTGMVWRRILEHSGDDRAAMQPTKEDSV